MNDMDDAPLSSRESDIMDRQIIMPEPSDWEEYWALYAVVAMVTIPTAAVIGILLGNAILSMWYDTASLGAMRGLVLVTVGLGVLVALMWALRHHEWGLDDDA